MTEDQTKKNVNLWVLSSTDAKLEEIARLTFRNKGQTIDLLVDQKYAELTSKEIPQPTTQPQ